MSIKYLGLLPAIIVMVWLHIYVLIKTRKGDNSDIFEYKNVFFARASLLALWFFIAVLGVIWAFS